MRWYFGGRRRPRFPIPLSSERRVSVYACMRSRDAPHLVRLARNRLAPNWTARRARSVLLVHATRAVRRAHPTVHVARRAGAVLLLEPWPWRLRSRAWAHGATHRRATGRRHGPGSSSLRRPGTRRRLGARIRRTAGSALRGHGAVPGRRVGAWSSLRVHWRSARTTLGLPWLHGAGGQACSRNNTLFRTVKSDAECLE